MVLFTPAVKLFSVNFPFKTASVGLVHTQKNFYGSTLLLCTQFIHIASSGRTVNHQRKETNVSLEPTQHEKTSHLFSTIFIFRKLIIKKNIPNVIIGF